MPETGREFLIVFPPQPTPGTLTVIVPVDRVAEMTSLEKDRRMRLWSVRAILSDHVPLAGSLSEVLNRPSYHHLLLNENPLSIYLHRGGKDATYYDFVGDDKGKVSHLQVRVETDLPSSAFFFAKRPLNEMLDIFARGDTLLPLVIQRLELLSPNDGQTLAYELILPYDGGLSMGPLGGVMQWPPFAPYAAIFREAIATSSPFYRLLCACRVYEGTNSIRKWLKEQRTKFNVGDSLPSDPEVDREELHRFGFGVEFTKGIKKAGHLFAKLGNHRNGIAHFLVEGKERDFHMYLADPQVISEYWLGSTILLKYANIAINDLRGFYTARIEQHLMRGKILPMLEYREEFDVRPHRQ
jgi:hypothetical protein